MSVMPSSSVYKWKKKTAKMSTKRKKKACKMSTKRKNGLQKCQKEKTDFKNVYKKTGEVSTKRKKGLKKLLQEEKMTTKMSPKDWKNPEGVQMLKEDFILCGAANIL